MKPLTILAAVAVAGLLAFVIPRAMHETEKNDLPLWPGIQPAERSVLAHYPNVARVTHPVPPVFVSETPNLFIWYHPGK